MPTARSAEYYPRLDQKLLDEIDAAAGAIVRSFVDHMVEDRDKAAIVRTIQSLAEVLGMRTTAEGVETADQARLLSALGCDFGQGFLFAHPMEASTALAYWRQSLVRPII